VKYDPKFLFIPLLRDSRTGQTARQIFDGSNDADARKGVPFLPFVDIVAHLEDRIAPKLQFWGRE